MQRVEVAIAGLGAMGSAAVLQLARRGTRVIGFDRFSPPHAQGSSHGATRVSRLAIGEGDHLTPLAVRSHALWREIERETGAALLSEIGALIISSERNAAQTHVAGFFRKTVAAAEKFGIVHELLGAAQIRARWPQFAVKDDESGYFEPTGAFLRPEACIGAQLDLARKFGAEIRADQPVLSYESSPAGVRIATSSEQYVADCLILAVGPWLPALLAPRYSQLFRIYRQVQLWFAVEDAAVFAPGLFPVFIWELQNSLRGIYGFPALNGERAIKIASEEFLCTTDAERVNREISDKEVKTVTRLVTQHLQGISSHCVRDSVCLYTVTPDFGFVIGKHPECERVIIVSPCSGHGFKHSPAIGEMVADMALGQVCRFDPFPFRIERFSKGV